MYVKQINLYYGQNDQDALTSQWIFKILLWPAYDYYSSDSGTWIAFLDMCMVA